MEFGIVYLTRVKQEFKVEGVHCQWKEWISFTDKSYSQCFGNGCGSQALNQSLLLLTGQVVIPTEVVFNSGSLQFWTNSFWFKPCCTHQGTCWIKLFPFHRSANKNLLLFKTCLMLPHISYIYVPAFLFLPSLDVKGRNLQSSQFLRFATVPGFQLGTYRDCS